MIGWLIIIAWTCFAAFWISQAPFAKPAITPAAAPWYMVPLLICDFLLIFPVILTTPVAAFPITGLVFVIIGLSYAVWARISLGTNWGGTTAIQQNQELVRTGVYEFHRHPIYLSLILAFAGSGLYLGEIRGYIAPVLAAITFVWKARIEERELERAFPEYRGYRRRTFW